MSLSKPIFTSTSFSPAAAAALNNSGPYNFFYRPVASEMVLASAV